LRFTPRPARRSDRTDSSRLSMPVRPYAFPVGLRPLHGARSPRQNQPICR
jgi:hypothetical protein